MRRAFAASLSFLLAASPCLGAELRDLPAVHLDIPPAREIQGPATLPAAFVPALPTVPELSQASVPAEPARQVVVDAAKVELTTLSTAKAPDVAAPIVFDAVKPGDGADAAVPVPPSNSGPGEVARLASRPRGSRRFVALGIAAATLAPVVYKAQPPLMLVYTVATAALLAVVASISFKLARAAVRRVTGRRPPARAPPGWRSAVFGFLLGLSVGAAPSVFSTRIVETGARIVMPSRAIRSMPSSFGREAAAELAKNPEGRKLLAELRDRSGTERLPDFYVGRLDEASGFSFPVLNSIFLDPASITSMGWTVDEFLADPAKQAEYIKAKDELIFHELFHAGQFRRPIQPGQLERFPRQLFSLLTYELEYEDYISSQLYAHAKLAADPHAPLEDLASYERFLEDPMAYAHEIDKESTYHLFTHVDARHYREFMAATQERQAALRAEGYRLLAKRFADDPEKAKAYLEKAEASRSAAPAPGSAP